jgi:hypothetical protein
VRRRGAADGLVGNTDVGDLRGHADHEREIHKVPVIGVIVPVPAWKDHSLKEPPGLSGSGKAFGVIFGALTLKC